MAPHALALCCVLVSAAAEGPAGVNDDIFAAVRRDDVAAIDRLCGADAALLDAPGPGGQTPTMHGVLQGKAKAVEKLIALGADLTLPEKDGYTPMHGAAFQGRALVANILADAGVSVNDVHSDGYTPVQRACWGTQQRHAATVAAMLARGAALADKAACRAAVDGSNKWTAEVVAAHFAGKAEL